MFSTSSRTRSCSRSKSRRRLVPSTACPSLRTCAHRSGLDAMPKACSGCLTHQRDTRSTASTGRMARSCADSWVCFTAPKCLQEATMEPSELLIARKIDSLDDLAFVQKAKDARAIVVHCDAVVYRLWMLTAEQAEEAKLSLKPDEHWLDLLEGETITKLEAVPFRKGISILRWTTSHRTTPWYGSTSYAKKVVAYTCPDGYHIGGFKGIVQEYGMTSIGALVARLPPTDAPSPPVDESSTEPPASEQESQETQEKQQSAANMWNLVPKLEWS